MTDDGTITNRMLLEHLQASRQKLSQKIDLLAQKVNRGFARVGRELENARLHREALQQDLDATIRVQAAHHMQLAAVGGGEK